MLLVLLREMRRRKTGKRDFSRQEKRGREDVRKYC